MKTTKFFIAITLALGFASAALADSLNAQWDRAISQIQKQEAQRLSWSR